MFGYYDPTSISVNERTLSIDFVSVDDTVHKVHCNKQEHLDKLRSGLQSQRRFNIAHLDQDPVNIGGSLVLNGKGEGVIYDTKSGNPTPVRLSFDTSALPSRGIGAAIGVMNDGVLEVFRLVMSSIQVNNDLEPAGNLPH